MRTDVIIQKLKDRQVQDAVGATLVPQDKSEFGYGKVCGMAAGLEAAINIILTDAQEAKKEEGRFNG